MDMRQAENEGLAAFLRADIRVKPFRRDVKAEELIKAEAEEPAAERMLICVCLFAFRQGVGAR